MLAKDCPDCVKVRPCPVLSDDSAWYITYTVQPGGIYSAGPIMSCANNVHMVTEIHR